MDLYCWQRVVKQEPDLYNALTRVNRQLTQLRPVPIKIQYSYDQIQTKNVHITRYYVGKELHRDDGPADIDNDTKTWYCRGEVHRKDGPAYISANVRVWRRHGKRHRKDGPAIEYENGKQEWFIDDVLHRENGPAIIHADGTEEYYRNGQRYEPKTLRE